jgi:hypothetical protein
MEEKYQTLKKIVDDIALDVEKFSQKNNRSAGQRVRKALMDVKIIASEIRKEILDSRKI